MKVDTFQHADQLNEVIALTIISILSVFDDEMNKAPSSCDLLAVAMTLISNFMLLRVKHSSVRHSKKRIWKQRFHYVKSSLYLLTSLLTSEKSIFVSFLLARLHCPII